MATSVIGAVGAVRLARAIGWGTACYYAKTSMQRPHAVAALTASGVVGGADIACQVLFQPSADGKIDWRRTASLSTFACIHYGLPAKFLYLWYDKFFGVVPTLGSFAILKPPERFGGVQ